MENFEIPSLDGNERREMREAHEKMNSKIEKMSDGEVLSIWEALHQVNIGDNEKWDNKHISMLNWIEAIYSEKERRGL